MTVRWDFHGQAQYATVQEAMAASVWMDTYKAQHYAMIRPSGTGQSVTALIPPETATVPEDPPANGQFSWTIHLEAATEAELSAFVEGMVASIYEGGTVLCAIQNSQEGASAE